MANTLTEMVKDLRGLLDEKDRLEAEAKKNKAAIEAKKQEIRCGSSVYSQARTSPFGVTIRLEPLFGLAM